MCILISGSFCLQVHSFTIGNVFILACLIIAIKATEPGYGIFYIIAYAPCEDSDQPALPRSLI